MAKKSNLLHERIVYKPFEYPQAYEYWLNQQQAHWLHTEVPMMSDLNDWKQNLSETEKNIIGSILKRICSNRNYCKRLLVRTSNKMVP
jgi:ribonucleoside-diphosphate reductase beta chain